MVPEPTRIRFLKENYHTIQKDRSITNRNSIWGSEFSKFPGGACLTRLWTAVNLAAARKTLYSLLFQYNPENTQKMSCLTRRPKSPEGVFHGRETQSWKSSVTWTDSHTFWALAAPLWNGFPCDVFVRVCRALNHEQSEEYHDQDKQKQDEDNEDDLESRSVALAEFNLLLSNVNWIPWSCTCVCRIHNDSKCTVRSDRNGNNPLSQQLPRRRPGITAIRSKNNIRLELTTG